MCPHNQGKRVVGQPMPRNYYLCTYLSLAWAWDKAKEVLKSKAARAHHGARFLKEVRNLISLPPARVLTIK